MRASPSVFLWLRGAGIALFALALAACSTPDANMGMPVIQPLSEKYAAVVVDGYSGSVLYQSQADTPRYPASLTKLMTLYLLFEALDDGRIQTTTPIPVSANAAAEPPTKIGFRAGEVISVEEAIMALIVKSANDVATAVGEYLGGSEEGFAQMMTQTARSIGMRSTTFRNAHGLPDPAQMTTARDMALLAISLRARFPHHYRYFGNKDFVYRGTPIRGHNELVGTVAGVDGLKTGYIRASGFNLATSVRRDGKSLVAVVMGGETAKSRNAHMTMLIETFLPRATRQR
jgi:D-alanyl-D-alanine carboxypeptidase